MGHRTFQPPPQTITRVVCRIPFLQLSEALRGNRWVLPIEHALILQKSTHFFRFQFWFCVFFSFLFFFFVLFYHKKVAGAAEAFSTCFERYSQLKATHLFGISHYATALDAESEL